MNYIWRSQYILYILFFFAIQQVKPITLNSFRSRSLISGSKTFLARVEGKSSKESINKAFERSAKRGPVTWVSFALVALAGGGVVLYVRHLKEEKEQGEINFGFVKVGRVLV